MFDSTQISMLLTGIVETLYMTLLSSLLAYMIGLPLGVILVITQKDGITPFPIVHRVLGFVINLLRSIPFIILLIAVLPFTKFVVGTTLGSNATVVPLVIASAPYIARLVESSLKEVEQGIVEAALSMGAKPMKIIMHVLIPEAKPSLLVGGAIAVTTILSYSAMSGFVGGGGLGNIAIQFGYYRYENEIMFVTVILLVIIVQIFQEVGIKLAKVMDKRVR